MNRRSDIGWFELIVGIILIIFGVVIMRQPVGVLTSVSYTHLTLPTIA